MKHNLSALTHTQSFEAESLIAHAAIMLARVRLTFEPLNRSTRSGSK